MINAQPPLIDRASCLAWEGCKQKHMFPNYTTFGDKEECCCGDFCCFMDSNPHSEMCAPKDYMMCAKSTVDFLTQCQMQIASAKDCDPSAPAGSPGRQDCTAVYECAKKSFGPTFDQCCGCAD